MTADARAIAFRSRRTLAGIDQLTAELTEFAEEECRLGHMRRAGISADGRTLYEVTAEGEVACGIRKP